MNKDDALQTRRSHRAKYLGLWAVGRLYHSRGLCRSIIQHGHPSFQLFRLSSLFVCMYIDRAVLSKFTGSKSSPPARSCRALEIKVQVLEGCAARRADVFLLVLDLEAVGHVDVFPRAVELLLAGRVVA